MTANKTRRKHLPQQEKINNLEDVHCVRDAMELKAGIELCRFAEDSLGLAGSIGPQSVGGDREM
jgi:hypothetical protein